MASAFRLARRCLGITVLLCLASPASAADGSPELERLLDLVEHRARLMPDVARWKWHDGRPVTDAAREAAVLAAATRTARAAAIEADAAAAFVAAQMAVSRSIQEARFAAWRAAPPPVGGPDLVTELRPAIGATTTAILEVLPRVQPLLADRRDSLERTLDRRLTPLGASEASVRALADALAGIRPAPRRSGGLPGILDRGELRIGTTGDYAPFSHRDGDGLAGIDVELGRALAERLGVRARFVPTSWPTLMDDLAAGHFDIGMSGISRTVERARVADFSAAYHTGGKTPIVRCADLPRLSSLAAIDRPGVRVVTNPGGTNERFARRTLERAELRVHEDNRTIFAEIAAGRADAMFTDAIEVRLQSARHPGLCAAMPGRTLTRQTKGWLLPRSDGGALRRLVDLWLEEIAATGELAAVFERHLTAPE